MSVKTVVFFSVVVILCFIINNLLQSIYATWQKKELVTKTKVELVKEKKEGDELRRKMVFVKRPEFTEEQARNKLFLVKPGEEIVVISKGTLHNVSPQSVLKDTRPNWRKWWDLFFTTTP